MTLITRSRRFGKILNMSMLEKFFSVKYADRSDLFEGLAIWNDEKYRKLQGTYPMLFLSFADVKETSFVQAKKKICNIIREAYVYDYWKEIVAFTRSLFNSTFKTNPYLERAMMTGITRSQMASDEAT